MTVEELKALQLKIIGKNKKFNIISTIIILTIVVSTLVYTFMKGIDLQSIIFIIFGEVFFSLFLIILFKMFFNNDDIIMFNRNFKKVFVEKALNDYFDDVIYVPEKGFSESYIRQVGMLNTSDRYYSNDFISALYKGIRFEHSDICIQEEHEEKDSDGNTKTEVVTLFRGRLMIFDFNKRFVANVQVSSKGFKAEGWNRGFERVIMDDKEFNDIFYVSAQDKYEAFYILTPYFMQKLKDVLNKLNCGVLFGFVDNRLHIAIDNYSDSFEHNVYKVIDEQEVEANILKDIKVITDFVSELELEKELFKAEELDSVKNETIR